VKFESTVVVSGGQAADHRDVDELTEIPIGRALGEAVVGPGHQDLRKG